MTNEEYWNNPALNVSRLALIAKSPRHYQQNAFKETLAMRFGTTIHLAILETDKFRSSYVVEPDTINGEPVNKRTKAHKEYLAKWREERLGAVILTQDEMASLTGILNTLSEEMKNPNSLLPEIFKNGQFEVPIIKDFHGRQCKGRADIIVQTKDRGKIGIDLKKVGRSNGASPDEFRRVVSNLHYDAKMAWYRDLFELDAFYWLAVEEKEPYAFGLYDAEPFLEMGRAKYKKWLATLAECERTNDWPWYTKVVEALWPASWSLKQHEEENWT